MYYTITKTNHPCTALKKFFSSHVNLPSFKSPKTSMIKLLSFFSAGEGHYTLHVYKKVEGLPLDFCSLLLASPESHQFQEQNINQKLDQPKHIQIFLGAHDHQSSIRQETSLTHVIHMPLSALPVLLLTQLVRLQQSSTSSMYNTIQHQNGSYT